MTGSGNSLRKSFRQPVTMLMSVQLESSRSRCSPGHGKHSKWSVHYLVHMSSSESVRNGAGSEAKKVMKAILLFLPYFCHLPLIVTPHPITPHPPPLTLHPSPSHHTSSPHSPPLTLYPSPSPLIPHLPPLTLHPSPHHPHPPPLTPHPHLAPQCTSVSARKLRSPTVCKAPRSSAPSSRCAP